MAFIVPKYKSYEIDDRIDLLIYKSLIKKKYAK